MAMKSILKQWKLLFILLFVCGIFVFFGRTNVCIWNCLSEENKISYVNELKENKLPSVITPSMNEIYSEYAKYPIDVLIIFTKATNNFVLQKNLHRSMNSLLKLSSLPIRLHILIDKQSMSIAKRIMKDVLISYELDSRHIKFDYLSFTELAEIVKPQVTILQNYFSTKSSAYYNDFLFLFSIFCYRLLPGVTNLIMLDIDILFRADISELYGHFDKFTKNQVIGISPELSPIYHSLLATYRRSHPDTKFGQPHSEGGFPGFNSGVLLIKVSRLKESKIFKTYLRKDILERKTKKYNFHGYLGDQDLYTLMYFDYPELFYVLPCTWNRHLCKWWENVVKKDLFSKFYSCEGTVKLAHGNCKTAIPAYDDENHLS